MFKQATALVVVLCLTLPVWAGLGSKDAKYVGGTAAVKAEAEGSFDTSSSTAAKFTSKHGSFEIPYEKMTSIEYGQKAGRRIGATIGWGVATLGLAALPMLLSKKRKHYLSLGWTNGEGKPEGAVLELGKDMTRPTLMVLETRSGKQVEYESDEAKKHVGN